MILNSPKETSTYFSKISSVVSTLNASLIAGILDSISFDKLLKSVAAKTTYKIEAVDANGARIETDMIYADRLGAGQEIYLTAFEYVEQEKLNQFKNATFRVLEINKYDY